MTIIPYKKIKLHTPLSPEEVIEKITEKTSLNSNYKGNSVIFEGKINDYSFKIKRIINYRNSFLPFISGAAKKALTGTDIELTFKPYALVTVFIAVWMGGITFACIAVTIAFMSEESVSLDSISLPTLIPFGMLLFGFLLTNIAFTAEYNTAIKELKKILEIKSKTGNQR